MPGRSISKADRRFSGGRGEEGNLRSLVGKPLPVLEALPRSSPGCRGFLWFQDLGSFSPVEGFWRDLGL